MKATELIKRLQKLVIENGDLPVVYGMESTGYGNEVVLADIDAGETIDGNNIEVIDLSIKDNSLVCVGGFSE